MGLGKLSPASKRKETAISQAQEVARQKAASSIALEQAQASQLGGFKEATAAGLGDIRSQAAAGLSGALGAAPRTGLGAAAAAGQAAAKQAGQTAAAFQGKRADLLGSLQTTQAKELGQSKTEAAEAALAASIFEDEAKPEFNQEERAAKFAKLTGAVNAILADSKYQGILDDDEEGAAAAIESLVANEPDEVVKAELLKIAEHVRSKAIDIGGTLSSNITIGTIGG